MSDTEIEIFWIVRMHAEVLMVFKYAIIHRYSYKWREKIIFIPFQFYGKLKTDLKRNIFSFFLTLCYFPIASKGNSGSGKANYVR